VITGRTETETRGEITDCDVNVKYENPILFIRLPAIRLTDLWIGRRGFARDGINVKAEVPIGSRTCKRPLN
jgi:hypothetical protein